MKTLAYYTVLLGLSLVIGCTKTPEQKNSQITSSADTARVIAVDELASHPEDATGRLAVIGTVSEVSAAQSGFLLGCEDACVSLPVRFKGAIPKVGSEVTVTGVVAKADSDKYVLVAEEVKAK